MDKILRVIKKFIPIKIFKALQPAYHFLLSFVSALIYWWPSNKMIVIGVTGTNGKTTVVHLISNVLEKAGYKIGRISSIDFKIGDKIWRNSFKMTMPGRFYLQKLLSDMAKANCDYVILEVTSEGIKQFRHQGINFDTGVFTNLTPEHIESHGGFENYKKAKLKFFEYLSRSKHKTIKGKKIEKTLVVNGDDKYAEEFFNFRVDKKYVYGLEKQDIEINLRLPGKFNVYNSLAAINVARSQGVEDEIIKSALEGIENIPGRLEFIQREPFTVVVDYAHTPDALCKVYQTLKKEDSKLICVLGSAGGGRDKWKRPELGKIAAEYCDHIILTNEDPYNENPESILDNVHEGISINQSQNQYKSVSKIIDRKEAIKRALSLAKPDDTVIITGKGAENKIMVKDGWIDWDDREVVRELLGARD